MRIVSQPQLRVQVVDDEIIVTLPGSYTVRYYRKENQPQLIARRISDTDDPRIKMNLSEFLAKAWKLANDKARELGWIV